MAKNSKPLQTLNINLFSVPVDLSDDFACGGVDGEFRAKVKLSARDLTDEGFVVEVGGFIEAVRESYRGEMFKASCEELAMGVVYVAQRAMGDRLERAMVEVQNLTGSVEIDWHKGEVVPGFPRYATESEQESTHRARREGRRNRPASSC